MHGPLLAGGAEGFVAVMESLLGFPGYGANLFALVLLADLQGGADFGWETVLPRGFAEDAAAGAVAAFGDAALAPLGGLKANASGVGALSMGDVVMVA